MIGARVGKYVIHSELSRGGMGRVYLARHEIMEREAVVKVLHRKFTHNEVVVERFFNEARAATRIEHPGIVEVFDVGYADDQAYLIMERLRGQDLAARLQTRAVSQREAVAMTRQILGALAAAHARGIVHRDLKPENVFVVPDPEVPGGERIKLLDFGIAKLIERPGGVSTSHDSLIGTPAYIAPEQCTNAATVDHRADLYAVGCILYELLCGIPPFGRGGLELLAAHLRDEPTPPRERNPQIAPDLERIVLVLLAKNPADRFPDCEALLAALDGARIRPSALAASGRTGEDGAAGDEPAAAALAPTIADTAPDAGASATADTPASTLASSSGEAAANPRGDRARRAGWWPRLAVAGVVAVAVALAVLYAARTPSGPAGDASAEWPFEPGDATSWQRAVADTKRALADQRWDDALASAARIPEGAPEAAQARALGALALSEKAHEQSFRAMLAAIEAGDMPLADRKLEVIANTSRFRGRAEIYMSRAREQWRAAQLSRAHALARAGDCDGVARLADEASERVPAMAAEVTAEVRALPVVRARCKPPAPAAAVAPPAAELPERVPRQRGLNILRGASRAVRSCRTVAGDARFAHVTVIVNARGEVVRVQLALARPNDPLESCVAGVLQGLSFPRAREQSSFSFSYTL